MRQPGGGAVRVLFLLLAVLLVPAVAAAHQRLLGTVPARDEVVSEVPRELRLSFNEPVDVAFSSIRLAGADGQPIALGTPRRAADSTSVLVVPVDGPMRAGSYTVHWSTASRDGHPVRGEYAFTVAEDAVGVAVEHAPQHGEFGAGVSAPRQRGIPAEHHPAEAVSSSFQADSPGYVVVRWANYIALLGVIGAVAFRALVLWQLRRRAPASGALISGAARRAAGVGFFFAVMVLVAGFARLYAQSLAMHGSEFAADAERMLVMLQRTVWGWGWLAQMAAAPVAALGFWLAARPADGGGSRGAWLVAAAAAFVLALTPALSGHAAAMTGTLGAVAVATDTLHVLAAAGWLGTLLVLLLAGVPAAMHAGSEAGDSVAQLVRAFSPVALLFAGLLVASGVVAAVIHSSSLGALLGSRYGLLLGLKLAVFLLVFGTGAYNFLRVQPALGSPAATQRLRRSAAVELGIAAVVLMITAVLSATARPYDDESSRTALTPPALAAPAHAALPGAQP